MLIIWRHGDDIVIVGEEGPSEQVYKALSDKMILKKRAVLGFGDGHDKTISLLNRIITLEVDAGRRRVVYEPDPRHIEILLHQFGFGNKKAKGVATPSEKSKEYGDTTLLDESLHTNFRSGTMRLSYVSMDLPHLQQAANKTARAMAAPHRGALARLKRAVRFLQQHPRVVQCFEEQEACTTLTIKSDSDWAGDVIDRKSTSCIQLILGGHLLRQLVSTQQVQAGGIRCGSQGRFDGLGSPQFAARHGLGT